MNHIKLPGNLFFVTVTSGSTLSLFFVPCGGLFLQFLRRFVVPLKLYNATILQISILRIFCSKERQSKRIG